MNAANVRGNHVGSSADDNTEESGDEDDDDYDDGGTSNASDVRTKQHNEEQHEKGENKNTQLDKSSNMNLFYSGKIPY
ncbi:Uncharacterized protein PCOAH_00010960 [Plasmodium coatneyi]|uniref:Uncharacterized protein n=1 Tax=Plasmodium coatneyi TaxID=208452 RepID=A0A1B1DVC1_9APIC|nr:Uncharacterized protein PCOAH_00010960 [Plasmodium coatneyi]ANQ06733.1 Uncharacterized protein PCOAH_00010960 [Plasmodium coatneyi]